MPSRPKEEPRREVVAITPPTPTLEPHTCQHLRGDEYEEYILRTQTRSLGGVSPTLRARVARQLFPYKRLPVLKGEAVEGDLGAEQGQQAMPEVPDDGNAALEESRWTQDEQQKIDQALRGWARWEVNFGRRFVKSTQCKGTTKRKSGVCKACEDLGSLDKAFKKAVYRVRACSWL